VQDAVVFRTTPDYFHALGLPLERGRLFDASDLGEAAPVALVSEALAHRYWPDRDPLGSRITFGNPADSTATWMTVVGVVGDVRQDGPVEPAYPQIYVPLAQVSSRGLLVALRTEGDPLAMVPSVRRALASVDPTLALARIATMDDRLATTLARPRVNALLLAGFAGTALLLAALGIYGVIAYSVVQRTRELGIRVALGAQGDDVLRLVLRQGMAPVAAGLLLGLCGAAAASRVLQSLLYGVAATDAATYLAVAAFLATVATAASYLPARHATRADPMTALRAE
jgi:putative ABC transport system permease protein